MYLLRVMAEITGSKLRCCQQQSVVKTLVPVSKALNHNLYIDFCSLIWEAVLVLKLLGALLSFIIIFLNLVGFFVCVVFILLIESCIFNLTLSNFSVFIIVHFRDRSLFFSTLEVSELMFTFTAVS